MKSKPAVNCPTCQNCVDENNPSDAWPFCSKRCKLIDLGEWANDSYRIPGEKVNPENSEDDTS